MLVSFQSLGLDNRVLMCAQPIAFDRGERIRHDDIIGRPGFRRYVTAEATTTFTQARYGARGWTTHDVPLKEARIFVETGEWALNA